MYLTIVQLLVPENLCVDTYDSEIHGKVQKKKQKIYNVQSKREFEIQCTVIDCK